MVGPGGTGKSSLLHAVARAYHDAGVTAGSDGGPVLVDDAHLLGAAALRRLTGVRPQPGRPARRRHRPWPVGPELTALRCRRRASRRDGGPRTARPGRRSRPGRAAARPGRRGGDGRGRPRAIGGVAPARRRRDPLAGRAARPAPPPCATAAARGRGAVAPPRGRRPRRRRLVLEAAVVGADPETGHLAAVTGLPAARLVAAVEAARATGHLDGHGRVAPFMRALLLGAAPVLRLQEMQRALIAAGLDRRGPLLPLARRMLGSGASGTAAVAVFEAAADEALPRSPATAAELFGGAVTAGGDPRRPRRAAAARWRWPAISTPPCGWRTRSWPTRRWTRTTARWPPRPPLRCSRTAASPIGAPH